MVSAQLEHYELSKIWGTSGCHSFGTVTCTRIGDWFQLGVAATAAQHSFEWSSRSSLQGTTVNPFSCLCGHLVTLQCWLLLVISQCPACYTPIDRVNGFRAAIRYCSLLPFYGPSALRQQLGLANATTSRISAARLYLARLAPILWRNDASEALLHLLSPRLWPWPL